VDAVEKRILQAVQQSNPSFNTNEFVQQFEQAVKEGKLKDQNIYDLLTSLGDFQHFKNIVLK